MMRFTPGAMMLFMLSFVFSFYFIYVNEMHQRNDFRSLYYFLSHDLVIAELCRDEYAFFFISGGRPLMTVIS